MGRHLIPGWAWAYPTEEIRGQEQMGPGQMGPGPGRTGGGDRHVPLEAPVEMRLVVDAQVRGHVGGAGPLEQGAPGGVHPPTWPAAAEFPRGS